MGTAVDLLDKILSSPAGSFSFIFTVMALAGWLIYYVTKKVTEIRSEHDHIKSDSQKSGDVLDKRFRYVEINIDEIRKDLSYLKGTIDVIRNDSTPLAQRHSPISLTQKGIEVSAELNAEAMIAKNWEAILKDLDKNLVDKNAYDIQQYCLETAAVEIEKFLKPEDLQFLKTYAFKNGNSLAYYSVIFGLIIRDKYLICKNIDSSEIDACDPNKKPQ
jgi:hypothetical protein